MTFHLGLISRTVMFQVGDRLLTLPGADRRIPWDAYANKTIFTQVRNGVAIVSYSGLAHVRGKPTDRWIAEELLQRPATDAVSFGSGFAPTVCLRDIQERLQNAIQMDFATLPRVERRNGLNLLVSGWSWKRRRSAGSRHPRSFLYGLRWDGKTDQFSSWSVPRNQLPGRNRGLMQFAWIGARFPPNAHSHFRADLLKATNDSWDPTDVETCLVDGVRAVAAADPRGSVGTNLMLITVTVNLDVWIKYIRDTATGDTSAYSPWILTRRIVAPPMIMTGGAPTSFVTGPEGREWEIHFETVPPLPKSHRGTMAVQTRPSWSDS